MTELLTIDAVMAKAEGWHDARRQGIGGSDIDKVMSGDWHQLWIDKTNRAEPEDLSNVLAVVMGTFTERLNAAWFVKQTGIGLCLDRCASLVHAEHPFLRANLDGRAIEFPDEMVFEAKHVGAFVKDDELVNRYFWQVQEQMAVTGLSAAYLSAFFGNNKWAYFRVERNDAAIAEMIERAREFWGYVERDEPPPTVEAAGKVEVAFDQMREVDFTGNNAFAAFAADWLENKIAAKKFEDATKCLKELVDADVKKASGHGVIITRSKANALTIKGAK